MKRTILVCAVSIAMAAAPSWAGQHGRGGGAKPQTHGSQAPKPVSVKPTTSKPAHATTKPTHAKPTQAKPTHTKTTHASAKPVKTTSAKPVKAASAKPVKAASAKPAKATNSTTTTTTTKTPKTTTTTVTPTTVTLSPAQQKLLRNTNLASKLQSRLPAGTDLQLAAAGFRNLGQFVAAVNVSNNLGIPFTELKTRMVDQHMSLGQSIQDARPTTTGTTTIVRRAESDADVMIRSADQPKAKTAKPPKRTHGDR